jgi:hypothetical protein
MSFNICRGTLGSLAMFTARRKPRRAIAASSTSALRLVLEIEVGERLTVGVLHGEGLRAFLDRPGRREASTRGHRPSIYSAAIL